MLRGILYSALPSAHALPIQGARPSRSRLAIAFGNEIEGCSPRLLEAAQFRVRIPIHPRVELLNVSAAAGITLYHRSKVNTAAAMAGPFTLP
ncbi:MAG: hypothetical protein C4333_14040 [Meiothermus sp.]